MGRVWGVEEFTNKGAAGDRLHPSLSPELSPELNSPFLKLTSPNNVKKFFFVSGGRYQCGLLKSTS